MLLGTRFADDLPELAVAWQGAPAPSPSLLALNEPLAAELGLDPAWLRSPDGLAFLTGAGGGAAQAYAGHQFGGFTPRLGDGRALLLGDVRGRDLHLKGSGPTPFSRGGDGFATVGPMLREHLVSEAMHALGIPTTRSLAVVATGRPVRRETVLPGALLVRVATHHLRVGTVEFARSTGDLGLLERLVEHAGYASAAALFDDVVDRQARLIASWMLVGFVHGVMNTDNMTLSGETIDYGPCAFMERFDPATVFSSIDEGGRYAYGNQPAVGEWNLARLGEALLPVLDADEDAAVEKANDALRRYRPTYLAAWTAGMAAKLGVAVSDDVLPLAQDLLPLLHQGRVDWTSFWRQLSAGTARDHVVDLAAFDAWEARWEALSPDRVAMDRVNPVYVPRNRLVEGALSAAVEGDLAPFEQLLAVVQQPYDERPGLEEYAAPGPDDVGYRTFCGT